LNPVGISRNLRRPKMWVMNISLSVAHLRSAAITLDIPNIRQSMTQPRRRQGIGLALSSCFSAPLNSLSGRILIGFTETVLAFYQLL